jgi:hypothetical protein
MFSSIPMGISISSYHDCIGNILEKQVKIVGTRPVSEQPGIFTLQA